jgi:hypothetical protein
MTTELSPGKLYQQMVLGRLGDDDPALVQARTPDLLRQLVADAGKDLRARPAPGEFSVAEVVGHMVDAEIVVSLRYRLILAADNPPLQGYEQDDWVRVSGNGDVDPDELVAAFGALRKVNLALWRRTPASERGRAGEHSERGPESYEFTFRLAAGHDLIHLDQGRETLATLLARTEG